MRQYNIQSKRYVKYAQVTYKVNFKRIRQLLLL